MRRLLGTAALLLAAGPLVLAGCARTGAPLRASGRAGTGFRVTSVTVHRPAAGRPFLLVRLRATTRRPVGVGGSARLTGGPGGSGAGPFPAQRVVMLRPGHPAGMVIALGARLPPGRWHARVTLVSGLASAMARTTLRFPAGPRPAAVAYLVPAAYLKPLAVWLASIMLALGVIGLAAFQRLRQAWHGRRAQA
jgi:hypothetical protein